MFRRGKHIELLTHLPLDKMAAILKDNIFKCIFSNEKQILKLVTWIPIDNEPALVQVMAWRRTGDKALPVSMMIQFTDALYAAIGGDDRIRLCNYI